MSKTSIVDNAILPRGNVFRERTLRGGPRRRVNPLSRIVLSRRDIAARDDLADIAPVPAGIALLHVPQNVSHVLGVLRMIGPPVTSGAPLRAPVDQVHPCHPPGLFADQEIERGPCEGGAVADNEEPTGAGDRRAPTGVQVPRQIRRSPPSSGCTWSRSPSPQG